MEGLFVGITVIIGFIAIMPLVTVASMQLATRGKDDTYL